MTAPGGLVRLQIPSLFDMVDVVQVLCDRMSALAAFDEDAVHWVGVAIRESVINAIKHGNRNDVNKRVFVEFSTVSPPDAPELNIRVRDEGEGFDPGEVANPLAPENVLKSSGRGIFLIRSEEIRWFYQEGASWVFPDAWREYESHIPAAERGDFLRAYYARLTSAEAAVRSVPPRWRRSPQAAPRRRQGPSRT